MLLHFKHSLRITVLFPVSMLFLFLLLTACQPGKREIKKGRQIHQELLTIDSHADTPLRFFRPGTDLGIRAGSGNRRGRLDFPGMEEGGLDGVFFAVFVGQRERTTEGNDHAVSRALMLFDSIHAVVGRNPGLAEIALSSGDLEAVNRRDRRAVYIGIENGYALGNDISLIGKYYELGARYITLCHTSNNDICDSSTDPEGPEHGGLSEFGRQVVSEMNRQGMMVDVSHISDQAFYDVLELSKAPVIASHSNARAICDSPRNLTDDMIRKLADRGGLIQLCLVNSYTAWLEPFPERDSAKQAVRDKYGDWNELDDSIRNLFEEEWYAVDDIYPPRLATVSQFCDHFDHVVGLVGIDHVGFGSDFDGGGGLADCYDVTELPNITLELLRRGYTPDKLQKFWSGNFLRVMKEVESLASLP